MSSEPGILPKPIPFGKYYLLERINVGGMAEVYKAKAFGVEGFERLLAVKKILASIAEDESFINMFIDEAKIAGQLNHPNIAQIFDLGKVDDSYFIAMEYISGKDLKTIFERARRIGEKVDIPRVCYIMMKVCEGLAHAHHKKDSQGRDLNIVHRDVSPQNILLSYEGEVKIIDFGIAKATGKTSQTQVGILKGKFSYMSPEQVRGLHVDHRSDIFSLGIVLYEMLTLERLFLGESDFDTLEKIRKVEMSPPSLYNPHIPKELEDIVLKALSKSPDDRFQSAYDFADAIEQFMRNQGYYFTNKDLAASMKDAFSADIEFENKKLEYYRGLNLQPIDQTETDDEEPPQAGGLEWGEEEMETQIFDRPPEDDEEQIISESDIVYAEDVDGDFDVDDGEAPTVEFDRWDAKSEFEQFEQRQGPEDLGPPAQDDRGFGGPGEQRQRRPTSQLPAEPRRDSPGTVQAAHPGREESKSRRFLVAAIVAGLIVAIGLPIVYFMTRDDTASVVFETDPASVQIFVDGKQVHDGATPITTEVDPGHTEIRIEKEGFKTFSQSRELQAGKTYELKHSFERKGPQKGTLRVTLEPPDASLTVDGELVEGGAPYEIVELEFGSHSLKAEKDGYLAIEKDVELDSASKDLELALEPETFELVLRTDPSRAAFGLYEKGADERLERGYTPETLEELAGDKTYVIKFEKSGYQDIEKTYEPTSKLEQEFEVDLESEDDDTSEPVAVRDNDRGSSGLDSRGSTGSPDRTGSSSNTGSSGSSSSSSSGDESPDESEKVAKKEPEPKKEPEKQEPAGSGTITIASKPAAKVLLNGRDIGQWTPVRNYKVKAGRHEVELINDKFNLKKTYYVTVKDGDNKRIINLPKK